MDYGGLFILTAKPNKSPPYFFVVDLKKLLIIMVYAIGLWVNYGCSFTSSRKQKPKGSAPTFFERRLEMEEDLKPNDNQNETKIKPKESFIFYRSFYEAIKNLDCKTKVEIYDAICEYSLNQNETEIDGIGKAILTLIKPQLDANLKRYKNGCSGGRPKTKTKPNDNQNETKIKPNDNVNVYSLNLNTNANTGNLKLTDTITDLNFKKEKEKEKSNSQSVSIGSLYQPKTFKPTVKITEDFCIDFENDEMFKPYSKAGPELRDALNKWFIKNKLNQQITKDFIARQIVKFATNLGKLPELCGENINEKTKD